MSELRKCIKCNRDLPLGQFDDNWRHKVNICKKCKSEYHREYNKKQKRRDIQNRMYAAEKRVEELKEILNDKRSREKS